MTEDDLKRLERNTFRATADSGLWDMYLASIISMLAIAPQLSSHLGDFWSSAVFLPVYALLYWVIHRIKVRVIRPRIGVVEYGKPRQERLKSLGVITTALAYLAMLGTGFSGLSQLAIFAITGLIVSLLVTRWIVLSWLNLNFTKQDHLYLKHLSTITVSAKART